MAEPISTPPLAASREAAAPAAPKGKKYVGPEYTHRVNIPGNATAYDPKNMADTERAAFIALYPPAKDWWA